MKTFVIILGLITIPIACCYSQEWIFTYDASGNRIKRIYSNSPCVAQEEQQSGKKGDDPDENSGYNNGQADESPENSSKPGNSKPGNGEINETGKTIGITPNPSRGKITLNGLHPDVIGTVEIYNVLGERIFSLPFGEDWGGVIDLSIEPKGIYMVKVVSGEDVYVERIAIE